MTNGGRTGSLCACVLVIVACGDDPVTSAGDASTGSTGLATTTTIGPVPTTSSPTSSDDASGTATGTSTSTPTTGPTSPITSDTSTGPSPTTGDQSTTATTIVDTSTGTSTTTTDSSTSTPPDTTTTTPDTTTTGGCNTPADCPPPGDCLIAACNAGVCGQAPAPQDTPCDGGVCDDNGACVGCNQPADCPPPPNACVVHDCVAHECTADPQPPGTPCDGGVCSLGECVECLVSADCPPPPGACVMAACAANKCGATPVPQGTPCQGGVCDSNGACVACNVDADCANQQLCQNHQCVPPPANCMDGLQNGSETDTDCGGSCPPCQDGDSCLVDVDCVSASCDNNVCGLPVPACVNSPLDPATGQRCPLFMACTQSSECGVLQGCQQWFCNPSKTCELNALVGCWTDFGGQCNAEVVFTQQTLPPVAKRFVPPDGVNFRELASLVFTVKNNTATDLYLDKLPLTLDVMGGGSKFDVSSVKIFDNSGGSEHGGGDLLVCLTADPFSFPANGTMGPCAGSAFSRVPKNGGTNQFLVNVAFAANKTFINGRSYRLRMPSTAGIQFKVGFNGPLFAGTTCGIPNEGYTGAWVTAQTP